MTGVWLRPAAATDLAAVARFVVVVDDEVQQVYVDRSWRGRAWPSACSRQAQAVIGQGGRRTAWLAVVAGTFPVPAHRYQREVGNG